MSPPQVFMKKNELPERAITIRQSILCVLQMGFASARDISQQTSIKEKEVAHHLEHLQKSIKHSGKELIIEPAECLNCGFVFHDRTRHQKPSACPECRKSRIAAPRFFVR